MVSTCAKLALCVVTLCSMQLNSSSRTWTLNLRDLLISCSISRQNLVLQPHDINMQILVDNNAKPHNQQIINSPWLLETHASSTCGKKVLMHAAKHQTSSILWSRWLITVSKCPNMLTHIQSLEKLLEIWPDLQQHAWCVQRVGHVETLLWS